MLLGWKWTSGDTDDCHPLRQHLHVVLPAAWSNTVSVRGRLSKVVTSLYTILEVSAKATIDKVEILGLEKGLFQLHISWEQLKALSATTG